MMKSLVYCFLSVVILCMIPLLSTNAEENYITGKFESVDGLPGYCKPVAWRDKPEFELDILDVMNGFYCDEHGDVLRHYRRYYSGILFQGMKIEVAHTPDNASDILAYRTHDWLDKDGIEEKIYQYRQQGHFPLIAKRFVPSEKGDKRPRFTGKFARIYKANMQRIWYGTGNIDVQLPEFDQPGVKPKLRMLTYTVMSMKAYSENKYELMIEINKPVYMHCYVLNEKGVQRIYPTDSHSDALMQFDGEILFSMSREVASNYWMKGNHKLEAIACVAQEKPLAKELVDFMMDRKSWGDIKTHKPPLLMNYFARMSKSPIAFDAIRYKETRERRPSCLD